VDGCAGQCPVSGVFQDSSQAGMSASPAMCAKPVHMHNGASECTPRGPLNRHVAADPVHRHQAGRAWQGAAAGPGAPGPGAGGLVRAGGRRPHRRPAPGGRGTQVFAESSIKTETVKWELDGFSTAASGMGDLALIRRAVDTVIHRVRAFPTAQLI
jgi:hypothetical protein